MGHNKLWPVLCQAPVQLKLELVFDASKVKSTDQIGSIDQKLSQQIKSMIKSEVNWSKVRSTYNKHKNP